jgi:magnesium chelatase family protein
LEEAVTLCDEGRALMQKAATGLQLSARAYHRVLRVARTIADLEDSENIATSHLSEALSYRRRFDLAA